MENTPRRFNLVEEAWIPVVDVGQVSLRQIFTDQGLRALGGNPIQKISIMKLLLAIGQAACTPKDDEEWKALGADGLARKARAYLEDKKDLFWLYGERPFLQMPGIYDIIKKRKANIRLNAKKPKKLNIAQEKIHPRKPGSGDYPDLPAGNNTILTQRNHGVAMDDSGKALFLLSLMPFALAGKQIDHGIVLASNYTSKSAVAKVGPSLGRACYLHTFIFAETLLKTIHLNIFTADKIGELLYYKEGLGIPPWEQMPIAENCEIGKRLLQSYMGVLIPMSRFVLYNLNGLYYTEGIQYPNHKEGWVEPTMAIKHGERGVQVLQAKTEKKPWRDLTALMSYVASERGYDCIQLQYGLDHAKNAQYEEITIWSGGMDVSGDSFGQKVKGADDYVQSEVSLQTEFIGKPWFAHLKAEMGMLEEMAKTTYGAVQGYSGHLKMAGKDQAAQASNLFWQLAERKFQELVDACNEQTDTATVALRRIYAGYAHRAYDACAPRGTARQLEAWAAHRPNLGKYLVAAK